MLERYYVRPVTVDRVRTSWIVAAIEQYVGWLAEWRYASRTVLRRIPLLVAFGEFAKTHGATEVAQLADHVEPFVQRWIAQHASRKRAARAREKIGEFARNPIRQMLRLAIPGYVGRGRPHRPSIRLKLKRRSSLRISPTRRDFVRERCISTDSICINSPPTSCGSD